MRLAVIAAFALPACVADVSIDAWKDLQTESITIDGQARQITHARVCAPGEETSCHARVLVDSTGEPLATSSPSGYGPADLRAAYQIATSGSSAVTIAIVDAYGYPNAESDLAVYRAQFGVPPCTTANGCF